MKKLFLTIFVAGCSIILNAQPILTQANFVPVVGESQLFYIADTNSVVDPTVGANVIFNYTGIQGYGATQTQYIIDPTTTTFALDFSSATYADTTGGYPINKNYSKGFRSSGYDSSSSSPKGFIDSWFWFSSADFDIVVLLTLLLACWGITTTGSRSDRLWMTKSMKK